MLTILQRLILGCSLLLAILLGLGLSYRNTTRHLVSANDQVQSADRAVAALAELRSSMRREESLDLRIAAGDANLQRDREIQHNQTQRLMKMAAETLRALDPSGAATLGAIAQDRVLSSAGRTLDNLIAAEAAKQRVITESGLARRQTLELRAALWPLLAMLGAILVMAFLVLSILRPLHLVAESARRMAQGDLQQRVEWRPQDDLGVIGNELNRMAVRLRDLRDTESGRRQMEFQLSNAVLQSIFEPVIVTDAKGHVLKLNQASSDLMGVTSIDRLALSSTPGGQKILDSVREAVSMQRAIANEGEAAMLPMRIGKAQRSYRLRTTPIRDSEARLLGAVTVLEDVTEMQDTDRFKTRFLEVASRKLRSPLEKLRLSLYTLSHGFSGPLRPLQADLIAGATEEVERLNDLMADLIDVAELDMGHRKLTLQKLRPIQLLQDAFDRTSDEAKKKNIEIEIVCFADLPLVIADRRAVRSILDNLLSNAVRYTPEGGTIRLEAEESGTDKIQFLVRDSGRGIEAERLPTIFGRFNASAEEGTGLGLALVRRLVESLGGQVSVESRLGHGTSFRFTLPVAAVTASRHPVENG
ncbi:MAG TPA: ATP-binding protein [Acidisarcina sp.]|nr:ATP-binding protein [Acidisarcina sp.]